jgi:hypothetical protein
MMFIASPPRAVSVSHPKLGPWLRDERGPYDGLVAAAVDRLGRNVVDCLNTGYKTRDEKKFLSLSRTGTTAPGTWMTRRPRTGAPACS